MIIARVTVVIISIIAIFIARDPDSSVFNIVSFSWAGFGASFGPVVLFSLFWKRTNKWGALAGMIKWWFNGIRMEIPYKPYGWCS